MERNGLLIEKLQAYDQSGIYPFHMPGHKRLKNKNAAEGISSFNPFLVDITETEGFDNLHHPEGILKDSMEWAAGIYGADKTYYLINGSTSGILSAVCGCVARGGRILISRNCHKSVYNAIALHQLKSSYLYPQEIEELGIQGGIAPEDVDRLLKRYMDTQAVLIVSPTYDGIVSDIKKIAEIVHRAGLPLIVDEAHGAHFRYNKEFPQSALELGADVVIQSVHKTLPSLTQTALLHIKCNKPGHECYGNMEGIDRYLHIYQSTSPSYVLMSSIESSIFWMEHNKEVLEKFVNNILDFRRELKTMKHLKLADQELSGQYGIYEMDISKIVVSTRGTSLTGARLDQMLREEYQLEMEMCGADYVTAITTPMDSEEGLLRFKQALLFIDGSLEAESDRGDEKIWGRSINSCPNDIAMTIAEAVEGKMESLKLEESSGHISGEYVYLYPPGIPVLAPGEWIGKQVLAAIQDYINQGLPVQGLADKSLKTIKVIAK